MKSNVRYLGLLGIAFATACGGVEEAPEGDAQNGVASVAPLEDTGADAADETPTAQAQVEKLQEFDLGETHYAISDVDGEPMMRVEGRLNAPVPTIEALDGNGDLTMLEMYLALQPDGVPHDRLYDYHADAVAAQGRADASIRPAQVTYSLTEKTTGTECRDFYLPVIGGGLGQHPWVESHKTVTAQNGNIVATPYTLTKGGRNVLAVAMCNFSSGASTVQDKVYLGTLNAQNQIVWTLIETESVAPNFYGENFYPGNGTNRRFLKIQLTTTTARAVGMVAVSQLD